MPGMSLQSLGIITVAANGTPVQFIVATTQTKKIRLTAIKSVAPVVNNTGTIYITTTANGRAKATFILTPGQSIDIDRPRSDGEFYDLSLFFVDADTNGDGVMVGYLGQ